MFTSYLSLAPCVHLCLPVATKPAGLCILFMHIAADAQTYLQARQQNSLFFTPLKTTYECMPSDKRCGKFLGFTNSNEREIDEKCKEQFPKKTVIIFSSLTDGISKIACLEAVTSNPWKKMMKEAWQEMPIYKFEVFFSPFELPFLGYSRTCQVT